MPKKTGRPKKRDNVLVQTKAEEKAYKALFNESKGLAVARLLYMRHPKSLDSRCPRPDVVRHFVDALGITYHESATGITYTVDTDKVITGRLQDGIFFVNERARDSRQCCKIEGKPVVCSMHDYMLVDKDGMSLPYVCNSLIVHTLVYHWDDIDQEQRRLLNLYLTVVGITPID